MAERLATLPAPQCGRSDLIGLLVGVAGMCSASAELLTAIRGHPMIDDLLKGSSVASAFYEEGRVDGRIEGMREIVQALLQSRFGPSDAELVVAVREADEAALQALVAAIALPARVRVLLGLR